MVSFKNTMPERNDDRVEVVKTVKSGKLHPYNAKWVREGESVEPGPERNGAIET